VCVKRESVCERERESVCVREKEREDVAPPQHQARLDRGGPTQDSKASNLVGYVTKFAPRKDLKLIARGELTFAERVVVHRVAEHERTWHRPNVKLDWTT
jgi:hypothetical protein